MLTSKSSQSVESNGRCFGCGIGDGGHLYGCLLSKETKRLDDLSELFDMLQAVVDAQAEDDGLWFEAKTAPEAYLQNALRVLHRLIEEKP